MRRFTSVLTILVLGVSMASTVSAGSPKDEGVRIALSAASAKHEKIAVRNHFGTKVTAQVTQAQLNGLEKRNIAYEVIPYIEIEPDPGDPPFDAEVHKKGDARPVPVSQVPWGVKAVYGDSSLTSTGVTGGAGVIVAVLDTGHADHPDFYRADGSPVIEQCVGFTDKKLAIVESFCLDRHGHGTHVTGTVAAAGGMDGRGVFGVAPDATVWSYKVITDKGGGYADDIAMGITTAADRGAQIITMSFGLGSSHPLIQDAIAHANGKGALLIAAVGNAGPTADTIGYPAAMPEVVGVAGLTADESVMYMSSRGITDGDDLSIAERELEVAAPGMYVLSTAYRGGYELRSGTSMAAPHVAGLAAKMWQGSASSTRSWLVSQAQGHDITSAVGATDATAGYDAASGYGFPQVNSLTQTLWAD